MNELGFSFSVRPIPPDWLFELDPPNFASVPEMWDWIRWVFLDPKCQMFNPDHIHLRSFRYLNIVVTRSGFSKQGHQVIGTTEKIMINAGGWKKERQEEQYIQWFRCSCC